MTLDNWMYLPPDIVLERKQNAQQKRKTKCGNCTHYASIQISTETHHGCTLKRRNWQACDFLKPKKGKSEPIEI